MRSTVFPEPLRPLLLGRPPKKPIFGFGRRKTAVFRSAEKKKKPPKKLLEGRKLLGGVEKVIWPPNTITRRRRKKKKRGFSAWAPKNIAPQAPAEKADFWFWAPNKKIIGGRNFFGGGRKSYLAAEHHNEAAPKKKKPIYFRLGAEKYDFRAPNKEQRPRTASNRYG